jgi:hypothetical protein
VEVILACALVEDGSVFSVVIDTGEAVGLWKKEIREKMPKRIKCAAGDLQLFLAKRGNAWLDRAHAAAVTLGGAEPSHRACDAR